MVLALQSGLTLDQFGARSVVGRLVSASMVKELGPVLTALMVTGRVGSGIAAELGSMAVTEQIAALRSLGTDPVRKLVVPRVIAGTIMVPVLTVISDAVGMLGAAHHHQLSVARRVQRLLEQRRPGSVHAGHLDGAHQAVRPRLRPGHDRVSRRVSDPRRHAGRRACDDPRPSWPGRSRCWRWTSSSRSSSSRSCIEVRHDDDRNVPSKRRRQPLHQRRERRPSWPSRMSRSPSTSTSCSSG